MNSFSNFETSSSCCATIGAITSMGSPRSKIKFTLRLSAKLIASVQSDAFTTEIKSLSV